MIKLGILSSLLLAAQCAVAGVSEEDFASPKGDALAKELEARGEDVGVIVPANANKFEVVTSIAKLVFDVSQAPDLKSWTEEKLVPAMRKWVVELSDLMASDGWQPPKNIKFQFVTEPLKSSSGAPAWACTWEGKVCLRADWFRENLDGEALGAAVHELVHIMQSYDGKGRTRKNCPGWLVEGYADYIRWFLFEPEADGCGYVKDEPDKRHYNDSYRVTAHFLDFVERHFPGTMKKLNAALRAHTFDNGKFWKDMTGKTVEELEAEWKKEMKSTVSQA